MKLKMKVIPQEVYLHGLGKFPDYCYSVDFACTKEDGGSKCYLLATGGADSVARIWKVNTESFQLEIHSELTGHQLGVNCVRFSPDGLNSIATASDDGKVVVWKKHHSDSDIMLLDSNRWIQAKILNVLDEVVCIAWSPCGTMIAAAVQREMTHVFSVSTGRLLARLDGHVNRVVGVCWDPLGQVIVSQSSDRTARVYSKKKNGTWYPRALLKEVVVEEEKSAKWKLFISESHYPNDPTAHFFKRPDFSPDGSMLLIPGGLSDPGLVGETKFALHLYSRKNLVTGQAPTATFATPCGPSTSIRFHPRPFHSFDQVDQETQKIFYVFVVTTVASFYVMRSDKQRPIAFGTDLHCTAIVDAAWSTDATILALSSTDGYVTLVHFDRGELGGLPQPLPLSPPQPVPVPQVPAEVEVESNQENDGSVQNKRRITPLIVEN